jgi:hypothetical protein
MLQEMDDKILNCHRWVVVITKNSFISTQFKALASFPLTSDEIEKQKEESKVITCVDCDSPFMKCKNGLGDCNYHDGPLGNFIDLFYMSWLHSVYLVDRTKPRDKFIPYKKNKLLDIIQNSKDWNKDLQNYVYLCCLQQHMSQGCKKGYHIDDVNKSRKDYKKYGVITEEIAD